ncbi:hypothetical protein GUJ93_ZPchr0012g22218 [Zizania palustris]|uniref:Uncharacterized protein n=1 Tax=Zizania palustris TaxID=103762 RepID=A0A8J5WPJ0_ZIZPA|nr:hypothetical protein GUJ93_ZPchr0012g22218 [Zizania palustris]
MSRGEVMSSSPGDLDPLGLLSPQQSLGTSAPLLRSPGAPTARRGTTIKCVGWRGGIVQYTTPPIVEPTTWLLRAARRPHLQRRWPHVVAALPMLGTTF